MKSSRVPMLRPLSQLPAGLTKLLPDNLIFLSYRGSVAHSTHVPSTDPNSIDDVDYVAIYIGPPKQYLGFGADDGRQVKGDGIATYDDGAERQIIVDLETFELRKFIKLLVKSNPNVLSVLWTDPEYVLFSTGFFDYLQRFRDLFATKAAHGPFVGYAKGQRHRMTHFDGPSRQKMRLIEDEIRRRGWEDTDQMPLPESFHAMKQVERRWQRSAVPIQDEPYAQLGQEELARIYREFKNRFTSGVYGPKRHMLVEKFGYDCKNAAHTTRLLRMGVEFLRDGRMYVDRQSRGDADELISIKRGEWSFDQVTAELDRLFVEADSAFASSTLPEEVNERAAENLLMEILHQRYGWSIS